MLPYVNKISDYVRDFSAEKCYYHTVLFTVKCIHGYYHFNFLTSTLVFTMQLLLVPK